MKACKFTMEIKSLEEKHEKEIKEQQKKHKEEMLQQEGKYLLQIDKLQERIQELAKLAIDKPTTTNTTTNVLNLSPFNMEDISIKDKINTFYNLEYLRKGHKGVAEFTRENLLLDDKGKLKYVCCDPSRMIFKYRDETGEMRKDVKANRLSKKITPDIMYKAHSIVVDEVNKLAEEESDRNIEFYDMYFKLKELEENPEKLGNELTKITT